MTEINQDQTIFNNHADAGNLDAWETPIVCRVEVDLPGWLKQLTGEANWEMCGEVEEETFMSFAMRHGPSQAEITLYHNGYAVVDVDGAALFDGNLTAGTSDCARLTYFNAESGNPILLN